LSKYILFPKNILYTVTMNFERSHVETIIKALERPKPLIQVLIGPRQVGKTTIARHIQTKLSYPCIYASADSPLPPGPEWVESQWRIAELEYVRSNKPVLLILDEAQKVRGWNESIKQLWDTVVSDRKDIRVLLLGSSALMLHQGLAESLAGRYFLHRCSHWSFPECATAFGWDFSRWLYFGGYPGAVSFIDDVSQWKRYVTDSLIEPVLAKDVLSTKQITKPTLLRHLFALAAAFPAHILSYNKMLRQLQDAGNTTTLAHYLRLLSDAFLISGLEQFSKGRVRRRGSSPKLILWNNALINAFSTRSFEETNMDAAWRGRLVENAVGAYFCTGLPETDYTISYWRDGNFEVDFVISRSSNVFAVEVKSGRGDKMSGMRKFRERYPGCRMLVVGGEGIPLERFFIEPAQSWLEG
jgi:hypothetical protein